MKKIVTVIAVATLLVAAASLALAGEDGKALYDSKCAMCHGKDGVAKPMAKGARNLNAADFQKEATTDSISKVIAEGKGKMPAYKEKLSADQVKAVSEYVKTLAPSK